MLQDLSYALRGLSRNKGWTLVVVLTLALGIGANTTLFTAVNGHLLRKLPVADPDTLVRLRWAGPNEMSLSVSDYGNSATEDGLEVRPVFSYAMFQELRKANHTLSDMFAGAPARNVNVVADGQAEIATGYIASGNFHTLLGVKARLGRTILPNDDEPGAPPVAVISEGYWKRRFGSDASVLGKVVRANNVPVTIVGIIPSEFTGVGRVLAPAPDLSFPLALDSQLTALNQNIAAGAPLRMTQPTFWWLQIMGRLKPGVTPQQVEGDLDGVFRQAAKQGMDSLIALLSEEQKRSFGLENPTQVPRLRVSSGAHGIYDLEGGVLRAAIILIVVVGLILLIVCANVANLLLSRATARQHEISVRLSMGATRFRLIRQLLTESVLLACIGGALGVLVALWGRELLPVDGELPVDWRVFAFAFVLSLFTGILFGIAPALRATGKHVSVALKETSRTVVGSRTLLGKALLVVQVAVSLVLLIAAGLFLRTVENLRRVDVGFNAGNLALFRVEPRLNGYAGPRLISLHDEIAQRLKTVPGVRAVTSSNLSLMAGNGFTSNIIVQGRPIVPGKNGLLQLKIGPDFFQTMEIPILLGRAIASRDDLNAPKVAMINEAAARRFFPNENPVGRRFGHTPDTTDQIEVIGVVRDAKFNRLRDDAPAMLYEPLLQGEPQDMTFEVRTASDPANVMPAIREVVRQVDPNLPLLNMTTQTEQIEGRFKDERLFGRAYGLFGGIALLLAAIGLFGLMSYSVERRTNEIGIRLALGAQQREVLRMIMRESLSPVLVGVVIGIAAAVAASRFVATLVFGLAPTDTFTIAAAMLVLISISVLAGYVPALRASRVDPTIALRHE